VSLNSYNFETKEFSFVTLFEKHNLCEIYPTYAGDYTLTDACKKATKEDNWIVRLAASPQYVILSSVRNQITSICAAAWVANDQNPESCVRETYVMVLTSVDESASATHMKKITCMLIKKETLVRLGEEDMEDQKRHFLKYRGALISGLAREYKKSQIKSEAWANEHSGALAHKLSGSAVNEDWILK